MSPPRTATVDLWARGEGFGRCTPGPPPELLELVTSANVACGFHAGDLGRRHVSRWRWRNPSTRSRARPSRSGRLALHPQRHAKGRGAARTPCRGGGVRPAGPRSGRRRRRWLLGRLSCLGLAQGAPRRGTQVVRGAMRPVSCGFGGRRGGSHTRVARALRAPRRLVRTTPPSPAIRALGALQAGPTDLAQPCRP